MPELIPPTLELITADPILGEFVYHGETGIGYRVEKEKHYLYLYHEDNQIGLLRFGSEQAGSIWIPNKNSKSETDVIGEYYADADHYLVIPIEGGLLQPEKKEKIHPLDYLVRYIENQP